MNAQQALDRLKQKSNADYLAGMKRFGIEDKYALGTPLPQIRKLAKGIKKNHGLALELWATGIHEARIMASLVDNPKEVTAEQIDQWVKDFYSWDLCDQVCGNLFDRTPFAIEKAIEFSSHPEEFVKRAGFVLMAEYAVHNKTADDLVFIKLMPLIEREAWDGRNFVKKAVSWALRQIGKRNAVLRVVAMQTAERILTQDSKSAKWIASDALKELTSKSSG